MENAIETTPRKPAAETPGGLDLTGRTVGEFHVLRRLGQGGMGQVFLAEQLSLKRKVALKLLRSDLAANAKALQRFKAEAEAVAKATHANIVQVYAIGESDGLNYMALEYVEGLNLREFMAKKGPPEIQLALSIMRQVAAALQRAAELGIIHRDIKPENILLTRKGEVKVADFGLARSLAGDETPMNLTQTGVVMGTPVYMSPEQVEGKPVDARTDIYSFGITCYHMMAGHPPFVGQGAIEIALKHINDEPKPLATIRPDLPEQFCAVIHKMMAKKREDRQQTGRELLKDLARVREGLAGATATSGVTNPSVELVPVEECPAEANTATVSEAAAPVLQTIQTMAAFLGRDALAGPERRWLWLVAGLTIFFALSGGVVLAGLRHLGSQATLATGSNDKPRPLPADAQDIEAICYGRPPQNRENVLRDAVEDYLSSLKTPHVGAGLCLDLSVLYLEQNRLDDADRFFTRLEGMKTRPYPTLGRFGKGIVLALRNQPAQSNNLFIDLFANSPLKELNAKPSFPPRERKQEPEFLIWNNPPFRFWIAQALYYNDKNGVPKKEVPELMQKFRDGLPKF